MLPYIWFFRGRSLLSRAIMAVTRGNVSHVELQIDKTHFRGADGGPVRTIEMIKYLNKRKTTPTNYVVCEISPEIFKSKKTQEYLSMTTINIARNIEANYSQRMILSFAWRAVAAKLGFTRLLRLGKWMDANRLRVVCSHYVDTVFDNMEEHVGYNFFKGKYFMGKDGGYLENFTTPFDILKSKYIRPVSGNIELWEYAQNYRIKKEEEHEKKEKERVSG